MNKELKLTRVRAGYGPTVVLEDVDLLLSEHGSLAVLGRNGVGKTTLLATIMGHTTFHAGSIEYQERPIMRLPVYERSRLGIGYVPQTRDVFPSLSVEENLRVAALPGRWTVDRVYELFPRLAARRRHMGNQISGGEQQMLAIGRALMARPKMILLDEPSMGLAPQLVEEIFEIVRDLNQKEGVSFLLAEQNTNMALKYADYGYIMESGRTILDGPSEDLLHSAEVRRIFLGPEIANFRRAASGAPNNAGANYGLALIAYRAEDYPLLLERVTADAAIITTVIGRKRTPV